MALDFPKSCVGGGGCCCYFETWRNSIKPHPETAIALPHFCPMVFWRIKKIFFFLGTALFFFFLEGLAQVAMEYRNGISKAASWHANVLASWFSGFRYGCACTMQVTQLEERFAFSFLLSLYLESRASKHVRSSSSAQGNIYLAPSTQHPWCVSGTFFSWGGGLHRCVYSECLSSYSLAESSRFPIHAKLLLVPYCWFPPRFRIWNRSGKYFWCSMTTYENVHRTSEFWDVLWSWNIESWFILPLLQRP